MGLRLIKLAMLGLAACSIWAAAPAPGAAPGPPAASDFEQELAAEASERVGAAKAEVYRSGVVTAPRRFDAVGLAGERRELEIRARRGGERWSEWFEVSNGDPLVVVGGGGEAQLRARGWRPRGTLHYVDVAGAGARTKTGPSEVLKPSFVTRHGWGADSAEGGCPPRVQPAYGTVRAVAVHHTVTSNTYTRAQAPGIVLAICRYHRNANGWNDIGYNALVDRFGTLYEGRAGGLRKSVVGAHAQGYNSQTAGISAIGAHTSVPVSSKARASLARFIAWKLDVNDHPARGRTTLVSGGGDANRYPAGTRVRVARILGHGRVGITACPGGALHDQLPAIRNDAQDLLARR